MNIGIIGLVLGLLALGLTIVNLIYHIKVVNKHKALLKIKDAHIEALTKQLKARQGFKIRKNREDKGDDDKPSMDVSDLLDKLKSDVQIPPAKKDDNWEIFDEEIDVPIVDKTKGSIN